MAAVNPPAPGAFQQTPPMPQSYTPQVYPQAPQFPVSKPLYHQPIEQQLQNKKLSPSSVGPSKRA